MSSAFPKSLSKSADRQPRVSWPRASEAMADNFSFAVVYGTDGPDHKGYNNPEIIDGIIDILSK